MCVHVCLILCAEGLHELSGANGQGIQSQHTRDEDFRIWWHQGHRTRDPDACGVTVTYITRDGDLRRWWWDGDFGPPYKRCTLTGSQGRNWVCVLNMKAICTSPEPL